MAFEAKKLALIQLLFLVVFTVQFFYEVLKRPLASYICNLLLYSVHLGKLSLKSAVSKYHPSGRYVTMHVMDSLTALGYQRVTHRPKG